MPDGTPENRLPVFDRMSISLKLPLITAGLVLLVGGVLATASYLTFRDTLRQVAIERLEVISARMITGYRTNMVMYRTALRAKADRGVLREFLDHPTAENAAAAIDMMRDSTSRRGGSVVLGLLDAQGEVLLSTDSLTDGLVALDPLASRPTMPADSVVIGGLRVHHDSLVYPVVARIGGEVSGFLVEWRHIHTSPETREAVATLMGSGAGLHLGNDDGSVWTDLADIGPGPVIEADTVVSIQEYARAGRWGDVMGAVTALPGTPWVLTFEFPTRVVFAPAGEFLRRLLVIAAACVSLGVLAAWWFSRQITRPLRRLTQDTRVLAASDGDASTPRVRGDELSHLRQSFDLMAQQVTDGRQRLEEKVAARTGELHEALAELGMTQEALVRREKLAVLGQLSSSVGHELRNPLGVMSNAIYYLESVQTDASPDVRRYLGLLRQQVSLSTKIVSDLLDFSRGSQPDRQPISFPELVEVHCQRVSFPPHITLLTDMDPHLPRVYADPIHLEQIMVNLYTNAVQAMNGVPGTVRVRARATEDRVRIEVSDSGPGIPPADIERIFEPLYSTKTRGIGLGLAVSRTLAQANGGELSAAGTPGPGATFILMLPAEPVP